MDKRDKTAKEESGKSTKRKDKITGKLFRRKSLKSVESLVTRIMKSFGSWAGGGETTERSEADEDDGGFGESAPCTGNSGHLKKEEGGQGMKSSSLPTGQSSLYGDKTPGVIGLKNHGNTCFMNAVVQCLSNTDLLAEYLGLERFKQDLCHINGFVRSGNVQHEKGEVTEQLASLVRALWTFQYTPQLSADFKMTVSKYGAQFQGNSQHDALEFLLWLLDRLHEDVNLSSTFPSGNNKSKSSGKIQEGGEEKLDGLTPPNMQPGVRHSFVQEHFQAQYKSSLTCPHCLKQSNTFDPFLCISLPIPLRQTRPVCVTLVFSNKGQRYLRVGLTVPLFGSLACLRRMVADEGKISPDQVILTEIYTTGFQRSFFDDDDLTSIAESDIIYAFQAPPLYIRGGSARISGFHHSLPSSPYASSCGPESQRLAVSGALSSEFLNQADGMLKILLLVCNTAGVGQQAVRFGPPFLMRDDRSVSWDQLQQSILNKLYYLMINGSQAQNFRVLFKIRVVGGSPSYSYLNPQDRRPLYHPAVDRALKLCSAGGPPHVKLVVEWEHRIKDCLFGNIQEEVVKDSESVRTQQQHHVQQQSCTLDECFELYTKEEQLAPDDAWKCPHCKQLQQGMVQMSLWTLPDILILHLKRFRQVGDRRNKLSTLVHFPLTGLDMSRHVVKRSNCARLPPGSKHQAHNRLDSSRNSPDFLYDLYAVCNHHGGMHGGHYTAYCRNSMDGQWYAYDDSSVELVPEGEVCTRGAYILFYQRRDAIPSWSASCSLRGSTSSSASDHWLFRLTADNHISSPSSKLSNTSSVPEPQTPHIPVIHEPPKEDIDGIEPKRFVRGSRGHSMSMRYNSKSKAGPGKVLPLRWSFGSKDRRKPSTVAPQTGTDELVEYLESGRRPRCTKEPIVSIVASPSQVEAQLGEDDSLSSPSGCSSLNGVERRSYQGPDSPRLPEGQSRLALDLHSIHSNGNARTDGTVAKNSSKTTRQEQAERTQDRKSLRGSPTGLHNGTRSAINGASHSRETTLKRLRSQPDATNRNLGQTQVVTGSKAEERRTKDGILSVNSGPTHTIAQFQDGRSKEVGHGKSLSNKSLAKSSQSNGTLNGKGVEVRKTSYTHRITNKPREIQISSNSADIKRAHSSSNIQSKLDMTLKRTLSLQRNGPLVTTHKGLAVDKISYATLQRIRYSSTSLGRQRPVPESCF
ncbi:ubiquitin carboxyl-terminal hydrolase 43-like [Myxocyprinus asiaticus]|uniref:ubiquitin carboxyl-terminal hydrolase 43-like n=1 Tax=Myxocyprinus asiaticus TaxID=70543 RepID=UPI00222286A6|nr:ubiquitin carboxyl-terminal hydrolase 43-like [Myxocyprinus asiaticus]